jgi:hypothetical protein
LGAIWGSETTSLKDNRRKSKSFILKTTRRREMKIDAENWRAIKKLFYQAGMTSMHCAFATANSNGEPHVTPIGSLFLTAQGQGFYFEEYLSHTKKNIEANSRVCVLAVNSSKWFWLRSLMKGRFLAPFSVRLSGTAGSRREATPGELKLLGKMVKPVKWTRGHDLLWKHLKTVRDIHFDSFEPVKTGKMSALLEI